MRVALINPPWTFEGSIYFGCREPHLPLELGYAKALLESGGHEVLLSDAQLMGRSAEAVAADVGDFRADMTVITTAPSYLFWRCAPPELRVPREVIRALDGRGGRVVVVGPHASVTPRGTLRKLGADVAVLGECEEVIAALADAAPDRDLPSTATKRGEEVRVLGGPHAAGFVDAPALSWPLPWIERHRHHHHRFDRPPDGPGAEIEASRGCPYHCTFCAKIDFRDSYRRRDLGTVLAEIDGLVAAGATYLYFIDEIFLPRRDLLEALVPRRVAFGVQTRLDLWKPEMIDLLGRAGCVSVEAGVESLDESGRDHLAKNCRMSTEDLTQRLIYARQRIPFVQANLIALPADDHEQVAQWRDRLRSEGVWANDPVPLFPYPSSPDYRRLWGAPDDDAWDRALDHYLGQFERLSDIQDERPQRLRELERACLA